jgi:hypothetical protein
MRPGSIPGARQGASRIRETSIMMLPLIDLSVLPDLAQITGTHLTGLFGSHSMPSMAQADDSIVILATFLYDTGSGIV